MNGPAPLNLTLVAGDDEAVEFTLTSDGTTPIDITGRTYVMQVRSNAASTGTPELAFTCTVPTGTDGKVVCVATDTATSALSIGTSYVWSLLEVANTVESTLIAGAVDVRRQVAKN